MTVTAAGFYQRFIREPALAALKTDRRQLGDDMTAGKLREMLADYDPDLEVVVRVTAADEHEWEVDEVIGAYAEVTDERSVMIEYGRLVILGDLIEEG